jgi:poly(3-hydroxyalkanoate) depolymerase
MKASATVPAAQVRAPDDIEIRFVDVQGLKLRVAVRPGVGVPLLLCNGIGANLELTFPFIRAMEGFEIIAFDLPGIGESDLPRLPPRMWSYARTVIAMMNVLGYHGLIDVAGVSWGGLLAQQIARQYPGRVRRLVLASTTPGQVMFPGRWAAIRRMATPRRYISRDYMKRAAPHIYGGEVRRNPSLITEHARHIRAPKTRGYLYQIFAAWGFSSLPWLYRLAMPALVIHGDDDPIVPPANARLLHFLIPKSRLEIFRGAGHLFMATQPDVTARAVTNFLRDRRLDYRVTDEGWAPPSI